MEAGRLLAFYEVMMWERPPSEFENTPTNIFQVFLNIVLDDAVEEKDGGEKVRLGMVVRTYILEYFGAMWMLILI
jgi:hypothetical protein